jgi:hypothetical protein
MLPRNDEHYANLTIQPYDVMREAGYLKEYLLGAAIKYVMRAGRKGPPEQDIEKAVAVLQDLRNELDKELSV